MTVKLPLRIGVERVVCERTPNDARDTHYPIFDDSQGCVAHVFDAGCAMRMAAAPELLDALQDALEESGCDGDLCAHSWHEKARRAIEKATGMNL